MHDNSNVSVFYVSGRTSTDYTEFISSTVAIWGHYQIIRRIEPSKINLHLVWKRYATYIVYIFLYCFSQSKIVYFISKTVLSNKDYVSCIHGFPCTRN